MKNYKKNRRRLFLHIGKPKTGTTAIQDFMAKNREQLEKNNILYPKAFSYDYTHHHALNWALDENKPDDWNSVFGCLRHEIIDSSANHVVLSSELFSNPKWQNYFSISMVAKLIFGYLGFKHGEVKVIVYLRPQDEALQAEYNQRVKGFRYCRRIQDMALPTDYYYLVKAWAEIFGKSNIVIRKYEKSALKNGLIEDFFGACGLEYSDGYVPVTSHSNPRLSRFKLEKVRICNALKLPDDLYFRFRNIIDQGKKEKEAEAFGAYYLLSVSERAKIMEMVQASNAAVARDFLGSNDGFLFSTEVCTTPCVDEKSRYDLSLQAAVGFLEDYEQAMCNFSSANGAILTDKIESFLRSSLLDACFDSEISTYLRENFTANYAK